MHSFVPFDNPVTWIQIIRVCVCVCCVLRIRCFDDLFTSLSFFFFWPKTDAAVRPT